MIGEEKVAGNPAGRIYDPLPQTEGGHEWRCVEVAGRARTGKLLKSTAFPDWTLCDLNPVA
jgi:hypothetical protein